ncbi:branched-chain amino acid ABC transporter permease [Deinococcus aquiradiocola]|uniref:Branched-chain amino acid ABC transporter permease n=1 Tax=Deinococcus aquiradiocola TaxID=393059 RepID=A0A917PED7_9DEIO|nr:branched-chain amino acid ABC transporter permease [Deinococcus aquiradiocola]GGJ72757.1 branched-chain amino acid ABC transporter permease [Deinococcus aquiradiocola]
MNAQLLLIQVFNGLVNGAFYALLSLGLAVIFGMLRIVNFAHGALYMLGAFGAFALSETLGLGFWPSLIVSPLIVGLIGVILERVLLRRLYGLDHSYNLLLTFGLTLLIQDLVKQVMLSQFAVSSAPYTPPEMLTGVVNLGFVVFPKYRLFVIALSLAVCLVTWYVIERTRVGAVVRAATENPTVTRSFGINVSAWVTAVFGVGVALAGLAGVLAAPIYSVDPYMGAELIITTFAVVVIGGMGSILGSVVVGFAVGVLTAVGAALYPPISNTLVFILMALVLLFRPSGLFGLPEGAR